VQLQKERLREREKETRWESERERERKKQDDRKGGTREYSKEVLKKNPLIILSVNRASPADDIAVENAVDNKNFARTKTLSHHIFSWLDSILFLREKMDSLNCWRRARFQNKIIFRIFEIALCFYNFYKIILTTSFLNFISRLGEFKLWQMEKECVR
jgi:hypothetical protein